MHYKDNPFYILKCSPEDDKNKIHEQAELLSFDIDEDLCRKAESILLNPKKRLEAEVSWFLGFEQSFIEDRLYKVNEENKLYPKNFLDDFDLSTPELSLSKSNLLAFAIEKLCLDGKIFDEDKHFIKSLITSLCLLDNSISNEQTYNLICILRNKSGISCSFSDEELDEQIVKQKEYYKKTIYDFLDRIESNTLIRILTQLWEEHTNNGRKIYEWELLKYVINKYEEEAENFFEKHDLFINNDLERIKKVLKLKSKAENTVKIFYSLLEKKILLWGKIAKPIMIYKKSCGFSDDRSINLFKKLRNLSINAYNEGFFDIDKKMTILCKNVFSEEQSIIEIINQDQEELKKIEKTRIEQEREKNEKEEKLWNYSHSFKDWDNIVFQITTNKDYISVSSSRFRKSKHSSNVENKYYYEDIIKLRWGITFNHEKYSKKEIRKIEFYDADSNKIYYIPTDNEDTFYNIVSKLLMGSGFIIMEKYLKELKAGKTITIGKAQITDCGIELSKENNYLFLSLGTLTKHFIWKDIRKSISDGYLKIIGLDNYSISLSLSNDWNAVVLNLMLDIFFDKFINKESRLSAMLSILQ